MIIYPSKSFVNDEYVVEKKLNSYFEMQKQQNNVADSIFSEYGVRVFVTQESDTKKYIYNVLPLIDFLCLEVFKAEDSAFNLKTIMTQWQDYVQAVRSHTSLFSEHCCWQKFNMQMTQAQRDLYTDLESLLLNDELRELDDIVRACCGAEVNKDDNKITELQIAGKLAQSVSALKKQEEKLQEYKNYQIEKAALEVKCEKLTAHVQTNESIATKKQALLQTSRKETEKLSEELNSLRDKLNTERANKEQQISTLEDNEKQLNQHLAKLKEEIAILQNVNLKQAEALETLLNEKQISDNKLKQDFKAQKQALESKLDNIIKQKDRHIEGAKEEAELLQLQILQLQEELEALLNEKQNSENQLKQDFKAQKQALESKLDDTVKQKDCQIEGAKEEAELSRLQILQLQEELDTLLNEKQNSENQLKQDFKAQKQALESKLDDTVKQKDRQIEGAKEEAELSRLQIIQLQGELETLFSIKQDYEFKISSLKEEVANSVKIDESAFENMQAENELMQLQITQLQEELEFYYEKPSINQEKQFISISKALLEKHSTLGLINRLVMAQGRE